MTERKPTAGLQRSGRMTVIGVLLLALGACSSNFIYNRLDTLAGWYIGSLVSLTDSQQTQLRQWLSQTLAWHRESELNRYSAFLRDLAAQVTRPGTPEEYEQTEKRFEGFWKDLLQKATPEATALLLSLSPQQVDELVHNMEEKSRERIEEDTESKDWHGQQAKSLTRFVKRWMGSVTEEQKSLIQSTARTIEPTHDEWLASTRAWQQALREALDLHDAQRSATVQRLLAKPDNEWTQEYVEKSQRNRQRYLGLIRSVDATSTARQRAHLQSQLLKIAGQLDSIAAAK